MGINMKMIAKELEKEPPYMRDEPNGKKGLGKAQLPQPRKQWIGALVFETLRSNSESLPTLFKKWITPSNKLEAIQKQHSKAFAR